MGGLSVERVQPDKPVAVYELVTNLPEEIPLYNGMTVVDVSTLPDSSTGRGFPSQLLYPCIPDAFCLGGMLEFTERNSSYDCIMVFDVATLPGSLTGTFGLFEPSCTLVLEAQGVQSFPCSAPVFEPSCTLPAFMYFRIWSSAPDHLSIAIAVFSQDFFCLAICE